jgi:hypothetical protein
MSMSRKDFTAIAEAINFRLRVSDEGNERTALRNLRDDLAQVCKAANPNFDFGRFVAATEKGVTG